MKKILFQENHIHSIFSDGVLELRDIFEHNQYHDRLDLVITDHVNKDTDWFDKYADEIKNLRRLYPDFSAMIGCEVKISDDKTLNTTDKILKTAEVVVGVVHHFKNIKKMEPEQLLEQEFELSMSLSENKDIDILGHPFSMYHRFCKGNPPKEYIKRLYESCVTNGIKLEYSKKNSPENVKMFILEEIAKGNIDNFSFGSDIHDNLKEIGDSSFDVTTPINVLVTGGGSCVGQCIIKALRLSKIKIKLITTDASPLSAGLFRSDASYIIPFCSEKNYCDKIIEICKKEKIGIVFIGTDLELEILSLNKEKIESATGAVVIVSPISSIQIADDKWKTAEFLRANGFPFAKSWIKLEKALDEAGFPLIVKPRIGTSSKGVCVVKDKDDLKQKWEETKNPIAQEYLYPDDEEYTCGTFIWEKKNYGVISAKRWLKNGDTHKAVFSKNFDLEKLIEKVSFKLDIFGPCNFQLRITENGPIIFEINCRFSGTSGSQSFLGFNIVNALLQKIFFKRPLIKLNFKESYMLRYWNELFVDKTSMENIKAKAEIKNPNSQLNII